MGVIKFFTVRFVEVLVVLLLIIFMPNLPPKVNFSPFNVTPPAEFSGKLALNERLKGAEHLFDNELKGAEAFAEYNGELYSSLYTGEVIKFSKGQIVPVVQFGKPCAGHFEESICGRPLGLKFDKKGNLFVNDAYMGIWKVDIKTGQKTLLVSMDQEIEGKKPMIPNSISLSENGDFYWTDSSSEFMLQDGVFSFLSDASGRLIHYNAKTKKNKVLMDGLHFANGVMLSKDEDFVIVNECARSRVYRFYLKGPKAGTHDIFADGLPGLPDNINSDGQGGFFIPLIIARDVNNPLFSQAIGPFPLVRKLFARILGLIELGFKTVHNIYPNTYSQMGIHIVGHFESMLFFSPRRVTILRYSQSGELLESLHVTDGSLQGICEAFIFEDYLYLGSPFNNYIGRISLEKAGLQHLRKKHEIPKIQTPTPTQAPTLKTPPTAAPVKKSPPPTVASVKKSPPPTAAPLKKSPPPMAAPVKQASPPVKQDQVKPATATPKQNNEKPVKQSTATPVPVKQAPPTPSPEKQPPVKQSLPASNKQNSAPTKKQVENVKQTPPIEKLEKDAPKVVPIKENIVPKSESIKPKK